MISKDILVTQPQHFEVSTNGYSNKTVYLSEQSGMSVVCDNRNVFMISSSQKGRYINKRFDHIWYKLYLATHLGLKDVIAVI